MRGGLAHRHDVGDRNARRIVDSEGAIARSAHLLGIADHGIDLRHGSERGRIDLRGAAGDDDARGGMVAARAADRLARLAHGLAGDGAGIDDHGIREPGLARQRAHHLRFRSVEATAEA